LFLFTQEVLVEILLIKDSLKTLELMRGHGASKHAKKQWRKGRSSKEYNWPSTDNGSIFKQDVATRLEKGYLYFFQGTLLSGYVFGLV